MSTGALVRSTPPSRLRRSETSTALSAIEGQRKSLPEPRAGAKPRSRHSQNAPRWLPAGRQIGTEAAPIRYVAEVIGIDTDPGRAIRWLIALMVFCCDPLAICLTAAASARRLTRIPAFCTLLDGDAAGRDQPADGGAFMRKLILASCLSLGACSSTGVLPIGPDTYRITESAINSFGGQVTAEAGALKTANEYCESQGRQMLLIADQRGEPTLGSGGFSMNFRCLAPGDQELRRPNYRPTPNIANQPQNR
jgi:hypothetical protein